MAAAATAAGDDGFAAEFTFDHDAGVIAGGNEHLQTAYDTHGFVVIRGLFNEEQVETLREEALAIARGQRGAVDGLSEDAAALSAATDAEVLAQTIAVHFPHKISAACKALATRRDVGELLATVLHDPVGVKLLQTMMFFKAPGRGGQASHQDEKYIPTRDASLTGLWVPVDDVDVENGTLEVLPGSHRPRVVWPHVSVSDSRFDSVSHVDPATTVGKGESDWRPALLKAGDALLFSGYLLHRSTANDTKDRFRRAFVCHYSSAETLTPWTNDGRFDTPGEGCLRDFTLVQGKDPYEGFLPRRDVLKPFVRGAAHTALLRKATLGDETTA